MSQTQENARSKLDRRTSGRASKAYVPECYVSRCPAALCNYARGFRSLFHATVGALLRTPVASTQSVLGARVSEMEAIHNLNS
eukprot:5463402-Prymnesium_polylepis.3